MTDYTDKYKPKKRKGLLIALIVFCALILIVITACAIYFESLLSLVNRADDEILETMSDAEYQAMMDAMRETVPGSHCITPRQASGTRSTSVTRSFSVV